MGADISLETFMQQQGVVFTDNGVAAPLDQILYNHGDNLYRLRIFVNPQTTYTSSASGAMQTTDYDIALRNRSRRTIRTLSFCLTSSIRIPGPIRDIKACRPLGQDRHLLSYSRPFRLTRKIHSLHSKTPASCPTWCRSETKLTAA